MSSHAPGDRAPPASSALCHARHKFSAIHKLAGRLPHLPGVIRTEYAHCKSFSFWPQSRRAERRNLERGIDVSLSADLDGLGLIANDPDHNHNHNQFVDVSYFAQTPGGQRRKLIIIEKPHQRQSLQQGCPMTLVFWFLGFMIVGDLLAYFIGRFVEYEWGSYASLVVFLALYFLSLWMAWLLSVWVTEPKKAAA